MLGDRKIGDKFPGNRGPLEIAGGDGLCPAISLDSWKEKVGPFAAPVAFDTKWRAVGADFGTVVFATGRE